MVSFTTEGEGSGSDEARDQHGSFSASERRDKSNSLNQYLVICGELDNQLPHLRAFGLTGHYSDFFGSLLKTEGHFWVSFHAPFNP